MLATQTNVLSSGDLGSLRLLPTLAMVAYDLQIAVLHARETPIMTGK